MALTVVSLTIALIIVIIGWGLFYAEINHIPRSRMIIAIAGSLTFWAFLAAHFLYALQNALGKVASSIFAFTISFLLALLFGMWLINLTVLDHILSVASNIMDLDKAIG